MVSFPNCKINLGLQITGKRADGYHDLETIFYPIAIKDILETIVAPTTIETLEFSSTGLNIQGSPDSNLCIKAYHLLKKDYPNIPSIQMHLHKQIPMGAGLGGGSADGAFTLMQLNNQFKLGLTENQLINYALQLGSDCPFFIINKACLGQGRGEILERINLDLSKYQFLLVNPGIHISTGWAFSQIIPKPVSVSLKTLVSKPVATWKDHLINDFEAPVIQTYPTIGQIKSDLYRAGAIYASMSGSGSTLYGIFEKSIRPEVSFPDHYMTALVD